MSLKITPVDESRELEGVARDYFGVTLVVARSQNEKYLKAFKKYSKGIDTTRRRVDPAEFEDAAIRAMSETILVGWEGFKFNGSDVPYTHENAYELLKNDRDVREFVSGIANDIDNYLSEEKDQLLGE